MTCMTIIVQRCDQWNWMSPVGHGRCKNVVSVFGSKREWQGSEGGRIRGPETFEEIVPAIHFLQTSQPTLRFDHLRRRRTPPPPRIARSATVAALRGNILNRPSARLRNFFLLAKNPERIRQRPFAHSTDHEGPSPSGFRVSHKR